MLDGNCTFNVLVYADADSDVPLEWGDSDAKEIQNGEKVQLRSFSTSNHRVDTLVSYRYAEIEIALITVLRRLISIGLLISDLSAYLAFRVSSVHSCGACGTWIIIIVCVSAHGIQSRKQPRPAPFAQSNISTFVYNRHKHNASQVVHQQAARQSLL